MKSSGGVNPPCGKVFAHGENAWTRRSARARFAVRGDWGKHYCNSSSSAIHRAATASDGIRQSPHETLRVPWGPGYLKSSGGVNPPCGKVFAHGENAWTRRSARARFAVRGDWGKHYCNSSSSAIHRAATASDGIRQSPRGDRVTEPTLGPSGRQERLNCWVKNRR